MLTEDFIARYRPCSEGATWARSVGKDMTDVWDALIRERRLDWLIWLVKRKDIFTSKQRLHLMCRLIREVPVGICRTLWDYLPDELYKRYQIVLERYEQGTAADDECTQLAIPCLPSQPRVAEVRQYLACEAVRVLGQDLVEEVVYRVLRAVKEEHGMDFDCRYLLCSQVAGAPSHTQAVAAIVTIIFELGCTLTLSNVRPKREDDKHSIKLSEHPLYSNVESAGIRE